MQLIFLIFKKLILFGKMQYFHSPYVENEKLETEFSLFLFYYLLL